MYKAEQKEISAEDSMISVWGISDDNGFIIDNEVVAEDGDKLYIIISAYFYGDATIYTDLDLIVGRLPHNNDDLSKKYLSKIYEKYNKKLIALKKADKECGDLEKIVGELSKWQQ